MNDFVFYEETTKILQIPKRVTGIETDTQRENYWTVDFFGFLNLEGAHGQKQKKIIRKTSILFPTVLRLSIPNRWGVILLTFPFVGILKNLI